MFWEIGMVSIADADRAEQNLALRLAQNKPADSFPQKGQGIERTLAFQADERPAQFQRGP